jgi:predicted Holliday junction resolvase-like endonuclease
MLLDIIISDGWFWGLGVGVVILLLIFVGDIKELKNKLLKSQTDYTEQKLIFEKKEAEYKLNMNVLATAEFEKFKETELEAQKKIITENTLAAARNVLAEWIAENEERIRKDAANRSVRNVMGKVTEQLLPFSEAMSLFNPKDARFLGSPIDLIIFDGSEELKEEINIVFIEVKTGTSALSKRQRLIKEAIESKRVFWKRVNMRDFGDDVNEALKADS